VTAIVALSGGFGGAKLAHGLAQVLPPEELTVVCNTGDDFEHLGLTICPDLDSVTYALAGMDDRERGWGRRDDTWHFLEALGTLSDATWFQLGDCDLALHVWRSDELRRGRSLSEVTREAAQRFGVEARIAPMSDQPVRTIVHSDAGRLTFQEYFVRANAVPRVHRFEYAGAEGAKPSASVELLSDARGVFIGPSSPWLSIGPLLAISGWLTALAAASAPVVGVSPIVGGRALKGPTAKLMAELGVEVSALGIARHYGALLDGLVIDEADAALTPAIEALGIRCKVASTVMHDDEGRAALARVVLAFADELSSKKR
jgi:LPPG:FO 2-phospho-L-lactate transferase